MRCTRSLLLALASTVAACGTPAPGGGTPRPASQTGTGVGATEAPSNDPRTANGPPMRMHYDLAAAPERSERQEQRTLVVDLGTPGAAKYTLGGWRTDLKDGQLEGRPVALVDGTRGTLHLPWYGRGDALLTLRARAFARGPVVVQLNGETLEGGEWPRDGLGTVRLSVPEELLQSGDNLLRVRTRRLGRTPDGARASVALDWLRLGPRADGHRGETPEPLESSFGRAEGGVPTVRLPAGRTLAWTMEVPRGARLAGVARGEGRLVATVRSTGEDPQKLGAVQEGTFDWGLDAHVGRVIRLELRTEGNAVTLFRPAVVVPEGQAGGDGSESASAPKNVLVFLIDTLRADKLTPYNPDTRVTTPGMAEFASTAATLLDARSQENWTKPSVATLLSSLMPWEHTATKGNSRVPESVELMPELMKEHGFHTGSFIANGYVSDRFGFGQGWDTYRNYIREGRRTDAEFVAADVLHWLDARPQDRPFFLYVHTIDPHVPYRPPEEFLAKYGATDYRGPVSFRRSATFLGEVKTGKVRLRARDKRHLEALYDGEISYHDVHFASILDGLERRGLADDTVVVVTSDHGEEFWDHGSVGHGHSVYDELLHVPLLMRIPGHTKGGSTVRGDVGLVDVLPTILDALQLPVPEHLSGRSALATLRGESPSLPRGTVSGFLDNWRTFTVGRTKLVHRGATDGRLYDLETDPQEKKDVAEERPLAVRHARALLGLRLADAKPVRRARRKATGRRKRREHREETVEIDDETAAQLEALGYVH